MCGGSPSPRPAALTLPPPPPRHKKLFSEAIQMRLFFLFLLVVRRDITSTADYRRGSTLLDAFCQVICLEAGGCVASRRCGCGSLQGHSIFHCLRGGAIVPQREGGKEGGDTVPVLERSAAGMAQVRTAASTYAGIWKGRRGREGGREGMGGFVGPLHR